MKNVIGLNCREDVENKPRGAELRKANGTKQNIIKMCPEVLAEYY